MQPQTQNTKWWQRPQPVWVITILHTVLIACLFLGYDLTQSVLAAPAQYNTQVVATADQNLPYHGMISNSDGSPLEGLHNFTFHIFAADTGGTAVWSETHSDVPITAGQFTVDLGSRSGGIPNNVRGSTYYLETVLNGETLSPREEVQLASQSLGNIIAMERISAPSSTSLDGDPTSIVSTTITLNQNAQAFIVLTCDCYSKDGGLIISDLWINGARASSASAIAGTWPNTTSNHSNGNRYTTSQTHVVALNSGENIIEMKSYVLGDGYGYTYNTHSALSYIIVSP